MKVKVEEIVAATMTLSPQNPDSVMKRRMAPHISMRFKRLWQALLTEYKLYEEERTEIMKKHQNEKGQIPPDKAEACSKEIAPLLQEEVEWTLPKVDVTKLTQCEWMPIECDALDKFVAFPEE